MATFQGVVGVQALSSGSAANLRMDRTGTLIESQIYGKYAEAAYNGLAFTGATAGTPVVTTVSTTGMLVLANPTANTGKVFALLQVSIAYISGTFGAGAFVLVAHTPAPIVAPSGGTAITPANLRTDNTTASSANARFGATVPTGGVIIRTLGSAMPVLATSAVSPWNILDPVDGLIMVGAGTAISLQGVMGAAGTSPVVAAAFSWVELPA